MSSAVDNPDPMAYVDSTLDPDVLLKELGFKYHGESTTGSRHWLKNAGRGIWHSVIVKPDDSNVNYRRVKSSGRGLLNNEWTVLKQHTGPVSDVRRFLMKWHTEALDVVHRLLDAEPDALDPRAELDRLIPHQCPECGSRNIGTEADEEGLLDCFNCGIWFDPMHPNNSPVVNQDRGEVRMEAFDPDDPQTFLQSLPQHPEAAGMKQPKDSANYWQYLFESREGYRCRLALSHSLPGRTGSYTVSLDVGGYHRRLMQETITLFWQSQEEFLQAEMQLREAVQRFIQAIKDRKERKTRPNYAKLERLWKKLFEPLNQGPRPARESLDDEIRDLKAYAMKHGEPRRITITFSRTTPESAAEGDFSETGWIDQEGVDMNPDDFDREEGVTVADKAAAYLFNEGAYTTSSSQFHPGMWYSTEWSTTNYQTGEEEERNFHLVGFSEEEERAVWDKFNDLRKRSRQIR